MLAYAIVAMRHGACYIPEPLAGFRFSLGQFNTSGMLGENNSHASRAEAAHKFLNLDAIRNSVPHCGLEALYRKAANARPASGTAKLSLFWMRRLLPLFSSHRSSVRWTARLTYRLLDSLDAHIHNLVRLVSPPTGRGACKVGPA
jgi:hypothetical protein